VTLVEMLVTLAILLLMMTAIVRIFQAATGSLSAAQAYQGLDNQLRQLDGTIRSDLNGVTCKLTPPNNPQNNPGYLEYGENEFADVQGEDADDYIRFTAKAPAGRPFTGRMWVPPPNAQNLHSGPATALFNAGYQPITITSDYAEIIYFLRNGNLYRRVLLVAPERQSVIVPTTSNAAGPPYNVATIATLDGPVQMKIGPGALSSFPPAGLGNSYLSWQGMNDLSAHPAPTGPDPNALPTHNSVVLNTLANLTNRENRWAYQRFANDFQNNLTGAGLPLPGGPDNLADDFNGDNVPDYYPSLYGGVFSNPNTLTFEPPYPAPPMVPGYRNLMAFPYVFPGAYSRPQTLGPAPSHTTNYGWIHSPEPIVVDAQYNPHQYDVAPLPYLQNLNHNPIDLGDNLPLPSSGNGGVQTWWGFPTWRETLSPFWTDPTWQVNVNLNQPFGLVYQPATGVLGNTSQFLPDMTATYRNTPQPYNDGPYTNVFFPLGSAQYTLWLQSWEDDLIMTGVRSFDIKAYDNALAAYADLGWGDDPRVTGNIAIPIPYLQGNLDVVTGTYSLPAYGVVNGAYVDVINQTFAHEGRMPPLLNDNRLDASYPNLTYVNLGKFTPQYTLPNPDFPNGFPNYSSNIGDDQLGIVRLRRVWDSWSTEYTQAPATGVYLNKNNPPPDPLNGFPWGPPYSPPIFPSYPPPYPAPLRGIQIQIRVADPTNQRIKTLTIRQDFTDKL
jgi:type II secretory pathway pseudopilin PulG